MDGHLNKWTQIYFIPERELIKVSKDAEEVFSSSSLSRIYQTIVKKLSKIYFNEEYWSPIKKSL